jgi:expansin (peptidoglycan-binding protein)
VRRRLLRWLIPSVTAVVATVVAVVLVTQVGGTAACAASGSASYYSTNRNGMCSLGPPTSDAYAAVGRAEYNGGAACGTYVDVSGPNGTTRVQIVDMCPSCPAGKIDLSKAAFARIGPLSAGIIPVTYAPVRDPQLPGPLQIRLRGGTRYSSLTAVLNNHGNPLSAVELQTPAGFVALKHREDNVWTAPSGDVTAPVTVRISDVYGHQAVVSGLALGQSGFQQTGTALYGGPSPSVEPSPSPSEATSPSAVPAVVETSPPPSTPKC